MYTTASAQAGPSTSPTAARARDPQRTDLWSDILRSADRSSRGRDVHQRKNLILLSEKHHGRTQLLDELVRKPRMAQMAQRGRKGKAIERNEASKSLRLALGYEVLEVKEDGEEESVPPISIYYPPSSEPALSSLVPSSLPPNTFQVTPYRRLRATFDAAQDTAVMILLDWSEPSTMLGELVRWLKWVDEWAEGAAKSGEAEEMRDRLQSYLQHYTEPPLPESSRHSSGATSNIGKAFGGGPVLPLGPGTMTLNRYGVPIFLVCTKADLMDPAGEALGLRGGAWEQRIDWVQQTLRTLCLSYGASLAYTATAQPQTYSQLRSYLIHRLYTSTPTTHATSADQAPPAPIANRFPFAYRANVFDRDSVFVPSGWDSWGKIKVLREGFDPEAIEKAWTTSLQREDGIEPGEDEGMEQAWREMIPESVRELKPSDPYALTSTVEPEQAFLARQLEALQKDPNRDPRASFRNAAALTAASATGQGSAGTGAERRKAGVLGPIGAGGLSLPGVDKAMAEMEGGSAGDLKDPGRLGRKEPGKTATTGAQGTTATNEQLHNFFQGLRASKGKPSSTAKTPDSKGE